MLEVRAAVATDALGIAEVHVRSWQAAYRGLLPDDYLDGLSPQDRADRYRFDNPSPDSPVTVVALVDGVICGFIVSGPAQAAGDEQLGEILALYVDPGSWRHGLGRRLMADARVRLAVRGFAEAVLWVLVGNERGVSFYLDDGWVPEGATRQDEVWGVAVDEVRYRRPLP